MPGLKIIRAGSFRPWLGVFETVCVRGGQPLFVEEHWRSLRRACSALGLRRPFDFRAQVSELPAADGRWRWVIGPDGPSHSFQRENRSRPSGLPLTLARVRVGSDNWDARYKTLSYLTRWQARREAPVGESLLLNEKGHIASGAMTNVFWVRQGRVYTPDERNGCRAGVVRDWVIGHIKVRFARSRPSALDTANEIFVTNSMLGVCPITRWQNRTLRAGPVTGMLRRKYAQLVRSIGSSSTRPLGR
jgi:branched-subunit amino acid aminotransferase/4-amino-4-deoxychorismate lyase